MANEQSISTSFVKDGNEATVVCPDCHLAKNVSVEKFRNHRHKIKVKCTCGHIFEIMLEFRRHRRKETTLTGAYTPETPSMRGGAVTVVNLSLRGAYFQLRGPHDVQIGQRGAINFILDDRKKTVFLKNVIIRSVRGNLIGCKFIEDQAYEPALGFYLQP